MKYWIINYRYYNGSYNLEGIKYIEAENDLEAVVTLKREFNTCYQIYDVAEISEERYKKYCEFCERRKMWNDLVK